MKKLFLFALLSAFLFAAYGCGPKEETYDPKNWPGADGKPNKSGKPPPNVPTEGINPTG